MSRHILINYIICFASALIFWSATSFVFKYVAFFSHSAWLDIAYFCVFVIGFYFFSALRMTDYALQIRIKQKRYIRAILITALCITVVNLFYAYLKFSAPDLEFGVFFSEQKWLFICLFFNIGMSYIDKRQYFLPSYILAGAITGIGVFFIAAVLRSFTDTFFVTGVSMLLIMIFLPNIADALSARLAVAKLKIINGPLKGQIITLDNLICLLGNQESDDVNLSLYANVNYSHAKIIPFGPVHSIADNDPYCNTSVNHERFTETVLKDGDIIGIGSARLKYIYR